MVKVHDGRVEATGGKKEMLGAKGSHLELQAQKTKNAENGPRFRYLRTSPQWHTSFSKATASKPTQMVPPIQDQVFKCLSLWGDSLIQTITVTKILIGWGKDHQWML